MENHKRYFLVTAQVGFNGGYATVHRPITTNGSFVGNRQLCDLISDNYHEKNPNNKPTGVLLTFIMEINESDFNDYCNN